MLVLAALLMIFLVGMIAFAMDIGYIVLVRSQLQTAADSAAMAAAAVMGGEPGAAAKSARQYAAYHTAGGENVRLSENDIELGIWDTKSRSFVPMTQAGNAVRVTARRDTTSGGETPLFFAKVFGAKSFSMSASAVATAKPRDVVFVVDLSGSMNDDTEPAWATGEVDKAFGPAGYAGIGESLMQEMYSDFGFGAYPGPAVYVGESLGVAKDQFAYAELTKNDGPLAQATIPVPYRIKSSDNELTRKKKAYSWIIDYQIAVIMPNAAPPPSSGVQYAYWEKYLDYLLWPVSINGNSNGSGGGLNLPPIALPPISLPPISLPGLLQPPIGRAPIDATPDWLRRHQAHEIRAAFGTGRRTSDASLLALGPSYGGSERQELRLAFLFPPPPPPPGTPPMMRGSLPPSQDADQITGFNNPNASVYPAATSAVPASYRNWIGYLTYTQFMADFGRDLQPIPGQYVPLSRSSPYCPMHSEATAGGTFSFPPREQPVHAVRRSLIAALQVMKDRNSGIADTNKRDWAGVITFDGITNGLGAVLRHPLSGDYDAAMLACTKIQPVGDKGSTTATESGLSLALKILGPLSKGGNAREASDKNVVLLTDGVPNAYESNPLDVLQF